MVQAGWGGEYGGLDAAEAHLDPAGVAIEGLDEAVLAKDPFARRVLVAVAVLETGVEEGAFAALVEGEVALEHVPLVREAAQGRISQVLRAGLGEGSEVGFDAGRHAVVFAVDSGAACVVGDFGFALGGSRAGGFLGVGSVGSEALFGDLGQGHGSGPFRISVRKCLGFSAPAGWGGW